MLEGRIVKALSGFYYVQSDDRIYQCKGRGVFRNQNITPLVGDFVRFDIDNEDEGYIMEIKERKNELVRPPIANIDQAIIVSSAQSPEFSSLLLDRFLILVESKRIQPVIFITKIDKLQDDNRVEIDSYKEQYEKIGYEVKMLTTKDPMTFTGVKDLFKGKTSVIAGQSGVGKSALLNVLNPTLLLETGEISKSLGRGRHTTRHVELIAMNGGLVADTPGFSSMKFDNIEAEELASCFPEMRERAPSCKFRGCMHNKEPNCAVKKAVADGEITENRYHHYLRFLEEINSRKPRY